MRNTVTFHHPAPAAVVPDEDGVLGIEGAGWFLDLLGTIPGIELERDVVQEDWGIVVRARRAGRSYWIGLSTMGKDEWVAHVHHDSFAWLQRFSAGGRAARAALVGEVDHALRRANASSLKWFDQSDVNLRAPAGSPQ